MWLRQREDNSAESADAVAFDAAIRQGSARANADGHPLRGQFFPAPPARPPRLGDAMRRRQLGQIITPASGNRLVDDADWCADNACFTGHGYPGDDRYVTWLSARTPHVHRWRSRPHPMWSPTPRAL